ncbi:unnamed protein product, partial [Tilletia laevis]
LKVNQDRVRAALMS